MHLKLPCRRRGKNFRSAGDDDIENRGFRNLKKHYVYKGCLIKVEKKSRIRWRGCRFFFVFFLYCFIVVGERGGSVVKCRTPEREVGDSRPTAAVLCP